MNWRTVLVWGPRFTLVVVLLGANIGLVVAMSTSAAPYSVYNQGWDGVSDLRSQIEAEGVETSIALDTAPYEDRSAKDAVSFVLAPISAYEAADTARLNRFLANGGTVVVAAENGSRANPLLASIDADARLGPRVLRDEQSNYRSSALPVVVPATIDDNATDDVRTAAGRLLDGVERVTLNHAATVEPNGAQSLLSTRATAYLDANGNGTLDDDETLGRRPVATVESAGAGTVIVSGDASMFTNAMLERTDNQALVSGIVDDSGRAILDYSQGRSLPVVPLIVLSLRQTPLLQVVVGLAVFGGFSIWYQFPRLFAPTFWRERLFASVGRGDRDRPRIDLDAEDLDAFIRDRHPDWDDEQVSRVTKAIIRRRRQRRGNE